MNLIKAIILIPTVAILFRLGGWGGWKFLGFMNAKYWRWWGIGITISLIYWTPWPFVAYWLATSISYGDNSPLKKYLGNEGTWLFYGAVFGLCSLSVLPLGLSLIQSLLGAVSFCGLMWLSNYGIGEWKLDHQWVEFGIGAAGTIMYLFK